MEPHKTNQETFDETQSLQVIKEMIEISRNNLKNDGILFILWGWIFFASALVRYLLRALITTHEIASYANKVILVLLLIGIIISANYVYKRRLLVKTYTGEILRYLWGAIIVLNLYILVYQLYANMNIDWLLSQYMLMLALGTFVTGGIIRFKPLIYGSISFVVLVQVSQFFHSEISILIAAISFITGFALPGHILYSKRKR
jgi:hypothetical protein